MVNPSIFSTPPPHLYYDLQKKMSQDCGSRPKSKRVKQVRNYKELSDVKIPKAKRLKQGAPGKLFPVTIVEEDDSTRRYKVHYVGYSSCYDEWKDCEELVNIEDTPRDASQCILEPFSLYKELAHRIKASLNNVRKESPTIKIEMPFDHVTFDGGLQMCGIKKHLIRGTQRYSITSFKDLNRLLGSDWHVRGINKNGDFCYAILRTVEFYLYHRRPLKEYISKNGQPVEILRERGHVLVFSFVRGDGTPDKFGKDLSVFCNN